jgi:hypothetical protein
MFVDDFGVLPEMQFRKEVPTIPELLPIMKQKINFYWGHKSLQRVVKSLGYKWRKCQSKEKFLYRPK